MAGLPNFPSDLSGYADQLDDASTKYLIEYLPCVPSSNLKGFHQHLLPSSYFHIIEMMGNITQPINQEEFATLNDVLGLIFGTTVAHSVPITATTVNSQIKAIYVPSSGIAKLIYFLKLSLP